MKLYEQKEAYRRAKKRIGAKIGFYRHLSIFLTVSILLIIINLFSSPDYLWFKWPLIGWGIGVFLHAMGVFIFPGVSPITEEMIKKEMGKEDIKKH